jgi:hypothetical protein
VRRSADSFAKSRELGEDRIGGGGPFEWLAILVVVGHEMVDAFYQLLDRGEGAAPEYLVGNQAEEALDLIEPRAVSSSVPTFSVLGDARY